MPSMKRYGRKKVRKVLKHQHAENKRSQQGLTRLASMTEEEARVYVAQQRAAERRRHGVTWEQP